MRKIAIPVRRLACCILSLGGALLCLIGPVGAATGPTASFDWSVEERFGAPGKNGLVNFHYSNGTAKYDHDYVHPERWTLTLDACGSRPAQGAAIVSFTWEIAGVAGPPSPTCKATHDFPELDTYPVRLTVTQNDGQSDSVTKDVAVKDFLVVSIGDSFGSGQGNPDQPREPEEQGLPQDVRPSGIKPAQWQDERCSRSAVAGPARAAMALERMDPKSSVTFLSFACSGATFFEGPLGEYDGAAPPLRIVKHEELNPQLDEVAQAVCAEKRYRVGPGRACPTVHQRRIDALIVSIGGNDWEFANIIALCLVEPDCGKSRDIHDWVRTDLRWRFHVLAERLKYLNLDVADVFVTGYPDPTSDENGKLCDEIVMFDVGSFSPREVNYLHRAVVNRLNRVIEVSVEDLHRQGQRWTFVRGIRERFSGHGYCAGNGQRWFRTPPESGSCQGNVLGTMHPTHEGHGAYRDAIVDAFIETLGAKLPTVPPETLETLKGELDRKIRPCARM